MKKLFITVLAAGITTAAFCQKTFILSHQDKKGFFAVSAGASLPVGRFGSCSPVDDQACMAGQGLAVNVSVGYRIAGPVGLMVRGEQHRNSVNTNAMLNSLYRNDTDVWTAKADNWSIMTVMAGPYISIPVGGRFSVDARLLAGRALAVLPNTAMSGNFGRTEMSVKTTGSQSTALALGGGLSLRYRLGRSISLHLNSDYSRADFTFNNLTSTAVSADNRSESSKYSSNRVVDVVSVSAGVAVLFGNRYRPF
ncbi:outer membrane beta-barrel protein [Spirosoma areae]